MLELGGKRAVGPERGMKLVEGPQDRPAAESEVNPDAVLLHREITQIYEGTNQIQRMVMARQLLK